MTLPALRLILADVLCVIPETVNKGTELPEHDTSRDMADCQKCRILSSFLGDRWSLKDDHFRTVQDVLDFLEAREAKPFGDLPVGE
jgi:hypothetical protein